jgi:RNA polymerase sigma-54 factor
MALGPRLDLRQSQSLIMTPQLQQAIKLLQMSNLELTSFVEQEIEANPLLEREDVEGGLESGDDQGADADSTDSPGDGDSYADGPETPDSMDMANSETLLESDSAALDTDYENVWEADAPAGEATQFEGDGAQWSLSGGGDLGGGGADLDNFAATEVTLREHLLGQANVDLLDPGDRMIAAHLIDMLDESGYLTGNLDQVTSALGGDRDHVEQVLTQLKKLDPPGVFAADLAECLTLQLKDRNRFDPAIEALLNNLPTLAKCDFTALRKICGVSSEDLADMIQEIKTLNPKPASEFDHAVAQPVTPDVLVRRGSNGDWVVELNSETLPRVLINSRYYAVVNAKTRDKKEQEYLIDCFQSANWLVKSLQQRAQTILKVATEIVTHQKNFFDHGIQYLKPLTLHNVAEVVGVHESTVSRVTNSKFLGFSRGVYELKYFFSSAVGENSAGDAKSAESVRFIIKNLINAELPDSVLSDDSIVDILERDGVTIARRTVAKYREGMRIPSSVQRRREKALIA